MLQLRRQKKWCKTFQFNNWNIDYINNKISEIENNYNDMRYICVDMQNMQEETAKKSENLINSNILTDKKIYESSSFCQSKKIVKIQIQNSKNKFKNWNLKIVELEKNNFLWK